MKPLPRLLLALAVVATSFGCDQATKSVATETLRGGPPRTYFADHLRLQYLENPGSFLGLGASLSEPVRYGLFVVGIGAFLLGLFAFLLLSRAPTTATVLGAGLLMGGGLSNWADRVRHGNVVVDFLNVGIGPLRTGVFNVADLLLELGVIVLVFGSLRPHPKDSP